MNTNEKTMFVFLLALSFIFILFAVFYLDYVRLINEVFSQSVLGFFFVRAKASAISLTTTGNLTAGFINIWPGTITILNLSAYNKDSGACAIPENSILYKDEVKNLPLLINMGDTFTVNAFHCAPFENPPKKGEIFYINMQIKYILADKYLSAYGKEAVHIESGTVSGRYI